MTANFSDVFFQENSLSLVHREQKSSSRCRTLHIYSRVPSAFHHMRIFSTFLGALQNEMHVKVDALNHQMHKLGPIAMGYFPMRICGLAASPSRHYDRSRALTINVSSPPTPHVLPARRTRFYYLRQHRTAIAVLRTYRHALFNASRRCHRLLLFEIGVER